MSDNRIVFNPVLFLISLFLICWICICSIGNSYADESRSFSRSFEGAVGLATNLESRQLSGDYQFTQFTPELVGFAYKRLNEAFWIRPGVRLGFGWKQPEMPASLQIREYNWKLVAETGIVWNWIVSPSFTLGVGSLFRKTSLVVDSNIDASQSKIGGTSFLPLIQGQLGVGIPIEKGLFMLEPYLRYSHVFQDTRYSWAYGLEATLSIL